MINLGKVNSLTVIKFVDFGAYLDGYEYGEVLMPLKYVHPLCEVGEVVDVFVYMDTDDRIIATTETPYAQVGDFAMLRVKSVNKIGAFLDWGLIKDLLVPFREQKVTMTEGRSYLVYIYVDVTTQRIVASAKLDKFLNKQKPDYAVGAAVDLIIENETDLGYNAIVNAKHWGLLYKSELSSSLNKGQKIKGYIKQIRDDEKIDLSLFVPGIDTLIEAKERIMSYLVANKEMDITDKSDSDLIFTTFNLSKKTFKKALGALYKERKIKIESERIILIK